VTAFAERHQGSIRFAYSCLDRILSNAVIQVLQRPVSVVGFLTNRRQATDLTPAHFRSLSPQVGQLTGKRPLAGHAARPSLLRSISPKQFTP
jgi:hypothetical protein